MSDVNTKLTALANEVRDLSGITEALSIDAMTTNISDANDEVSTQADLIDQIMSTVNELPTANSGDSYKYILHGSYTLSRNPTYDGSLLLEPIEIAFESGKASSYFPKSVDYMTCADIEKIYIDSDKIEIHPIIKNIYAINYYYVTPGVWGNGNYDFLNESYRIINIEKPVEVSKNVYELFMSLLRTDEYPMQPYEVGYSDGYNAGWRDCEEELGGAGGDMLIEYTPLLVYNESGAPISLNGGFEPVIPLRGGRILFAAACSTDTFSSIYFYAVNWTDFENNEYEVLELLTPIEAGYSGHNGEFMISGYINFDYDPPQAGLLITSLPLEMEG